MTCLPPDLAELRESRFFVLFKLFFSALLFTLSEKEELLQERRIRNAEQIFFFFAQRGWENYRGNEKEGERWEKVGVLDCEGLC